MKYLLLITLLLSLLHPKMLKLYCKSYGDGSIQKTLVINIDVNNTRLYFENIDYPSYFYKDFHDFIQVKFFEDANKSSRMIVELNKYFGDFRILKEIRNSEGKYEDTLYFKGVCVKTDPLF